MFWLHSINCVLMREGPEEDAKNQLEGGKWWLVLSNRKTLINYLIKI